MRWQLRPLSAADDPALASIIRSVLSEFGANRPGFAWSDPSLDAMAGCYSRPGCRYLVAESGGRLLGGAGFGPLDDGPEGVCELQKMYLLADARGQGIGRALLERLMGAAAVQGYRQMYIETLAGMDAALRLYQRVGFQALPGPLGDTGHHGCNRWLLRELP
jgi:putative acetyltransferase